MRKTKNLIPIAFTLAMICVRCDCKTPLRKGAPNTQNTTTNTQNLRTQVGKNNNEPNTQPGQDSRGSLGDEQNTPGRNSSPNASHNTKGGLQNLGNTCYMNATLQVVARLGLVELSGNTALDKSLKFVLEQLRENEPIPKKELETLYREIIAFCTLGVNTQEDAGELLIRLLDGRWSQGFVSKTKESRKCSMGHTWSGPELDEPILMVEFNKTSMQENLGQYFAKKTRHGIECSACGGAKRDVEFTPKFSTLPKKLIVQLNRFADLTNKINTSISGAESITLKKEWMVSSAASPASTDVTYELKGVIVHSGSSLASGHYYSWVKNAKGAWVEYNDENVSNATDKKGIENGYIFVYEKK